MAKKRVVKRTRTRPVKRAAPPPRPKSAVAAEAAAAAGPAPEVHQWRRELRRSIARVRYERQRQGELVAEGIRIGATWTEVGRELGTSRQNAYKRFAGAVAAVNETAGAGS